MIRPFRPGDGAEKKEKTKVDCPFLTHLVNLPCERTFDELSTLYEKHFEKSRTALGIFDRLMRAAKLSVRTIGTVFFALDPQDNWLELINTAYFNEPVTDEKFEKFILYVGLTVAPNIPPNLRKRLSSEDDYDVSALSALLELPIVVRHANLLIIDTTKQEAQLLEPMGFAESPWRNNLRSSLEAFLADTSFFRGKAYKIDDMEISCPRKGVQAVTKSERFCSAWAILIAYLHVVCHESIRVIQETFIAQGEAFLTRLIAHWICYVAEIDG